ncbi:GNAT family N-acetyltransferase [Streptomyces boluensis]|uniref:N-acetyltransferase n=1 Tax=Streptomyces boluensis TaxID=1775135 RepID=A0A964XN01_9ACTN|nr:GNAT family N-acetyltransferase [Streptomyces boluensis]NBE53272.1 N-acetyltransferase [Streptomyces boluensis]
MSGLRELLNRRFRSPHGTVRFHLDAPRGEAAGPRVLVFLDADDRTVGQLDHQVCGVCSAAFVRNIAVASHWQGRGVGREALTLLLDLAPGHRWSTSRQSTEGRGFFAALAEETGVDFVERGGRCPHMSTRA